MEDLQDEVERLLRRIDVEGLRVVATHLQIQDVDGMAQRQLLREIQAVFDDAVDEPTREGYLRNLPIPLDHREQYNLILNPIDPPPLEEVVDNPAGVVVEGGADGEHNVQNVAENVGGENGNQNDAVAPVVAPGMVFQAIFILI